MNTEPHETRVEKPEEKADSLRLQFDFSPESYQQLQKIKAKAAAQTNGEVVSNALRLYEWFLDQQRSEFNRIQVTNGEIVKEIEIIL
jgi:hypothetical protein